MKSVIIYSSKTGNTKKIANAIQEKLNAQMICEVEKLENFDYKQYDLIVVGGWIDKGHMNETIKKFMDNIHEKKIAFFFTLGAYPTSMHAYDCINNIKSDFEKNNNNVIAHFHCQGAIDPKLIEYMKNLPKGHGHGVDEDRTRRWEDAKNHPNQEDMHAAYNFVSTIKRVFEKNV